MCEAGKVSFTGSSSCVASLAADHAWDFRGCDSSVPVVDATGLAATLVNGAACTPDGVSFDGVDDYVDLDDWEWGGALTIEVYVKFESFDDWSRVLDFGDGNHVDSISIATRLDPSLIIFSVSQNVTFVKLEDSKLTWDLGAWTHVVATVAGSSMKIYKNGALAGVQEGGHEPLLLTRANHWLGREPSDYSFFVGCIGFLWMWQGDELGPEDVGRLYDARDEGAA
jgi:hypothetical protein